MPRFTPLAVGVGLILGLSALMTSDALADSKLLARGLFTIGAVITVASYRRRAHEPPPP